MSRSAERNVRSWGKVAIPAARVGSPDSARPSPSRCAPSQVGAGWSKLRDWLNEHHYRRQRGAHRGPLRSLAALRLMLSHIATRYRLRPKVGSDTGRAPS